MSILSALKAKGAKGKNIEEAVKTLPIGGGSGGGVLVVNVTTEGQTTTLDKTWQEIFDSDFPVVVGTYEDAKWWAVPVEVSFNTSTYVVDIGNSQRFECEAADGYPSMTQG